MSLDELSEAFKNANIAQGGGQGTLDENPESLPQGGESVAGISSDQKVKERKNSECGKRVKKRKLIDQSVHSLHTFGKENEQIMHQTYSMIENLQSMQVEIKKQKAEVRVSQNKTITAQENIVEKLWQHLMVASNQLEVAAQFAVLSPNADRDGRMPSERKPSLDGIIELKHRQMVLNDKIELLCKAIINEEP